MTPNAAAPTLLIWPWWQRLTHWGLAAAVTTALITYRGGPIHENAGYAALAFAALRIALGLFGPVVTRFASFVRGWTKTLAYARAVLAHAEPRHLNHNPLGAWMVVALLAVSSLAALSGWLYTTDHFWGDDHVILLHACLAWPIVGLVCLHLGGVVHASLRHRENLAASMLNGRKRAETSSGASDQAPGA